MPNKIVQVPWSSYRSVLLPLIERTENRNNDHFADQIDKALSQERAFLFVGIDGFMVLEPHSRRGKPYLNIMFALNDKPEAIPRYHSKIEELAKDFGAQWITTQTKVKALRPHIESQGFDLVNEIDGVMFFKKILQE